MYNASFRQVVHKMGEPTPKGAPDVAYFRGAEKCYKKLSANERVTNNTNV
jgi:hypothetical protein